MKDDVTTFEEYLREQHAIDYSGLDDDMPDAFEKWLEDLDGYEYLEFGTLFGKRRLKDFLTK